MKFCFSMQWQDIISRTLSLELNFYRQCSKVNLKNLPLKEKFSWTSRNSLRFKPHFYIGQEEIQSNACSASGAKVNISTRRGSLIKKWSVKSTAAKKSFLQKGKAEAIEHAEDYKAGHNNKKQKVQWNNKSRFKHFVFWKTLGKDLARRSWRFLGMHFSQWGRQSEKNKRTMNAGEHKWL